MKYSLLFLLPALFITVSCWQQAKSSNEEKVPVSPSTDTLKPFGTYLHFDTIPYTAADLVTPGRGVYEWMGQNSVDVPEAGKSTRPLDAYFRFAWNDFEDEKENNFDWSMFDKQINNAIDNHQTFSFRIMPTCAVCTAKKINGASIQYPLWLHNKMQNEKAKDWIAQNNMWEPNWNSASYLNAWKALNAALNDHINSSSYKGIAYKSVIYFIDASGWGNFGEWHNAFVINSPSDYPEGTEPTIATLDSLISYQLHAYEHFFMVAFPGMWDGHQLRNTWVDPAVGYYASFARNAAGPLGYRRDNLGDISHYIDKNWGINNPTVFNNVAFDTVIENRYRYALVTGEPIPNGNPVNGCDYGDMENQVRKYHVTSFANGNFAEYNKPCMQENIRAASKACGYRLQISSGSISSRIISGDSFRIMLNWCNAGIAPVYESWKVQFELRDGNNVIQTWNSSFNPRLFLPGTKSVADNFLLPPVHAGSYKLFIIIRDPNGYRQPLLLANNNAPGDNGYFIADLLVINTNKKSGR